MIPEAGTPLGNNLFKIRLAIKSKGKGKSGGARVITLVLHRKETIVLLTIYYKSEVSDIPVQVLLKMVKESGAKN